MSERSERSDHTDPSRRPPLAIHLFVFLQTTLVIGVIVAGLLQDDVTAPPPLTVMTVGLICIGLLRRSRIAWWAGVLWLTFNIGSVIAQGGSGALAILLLAHSGTCLLLLAASTTRTWTAPPQPAAPPRATTASGKSYR